MQLDLFDENSEINLWTNNNSSKPLMLIDDDQYINRPSLFSQLISQGDPKYFYYLDENLDSNIEKHQEKQNISQSNHPYNGNLFIGQQTDEQRKCIFLLNNSKMNTQSNINYFSTNIFGDSQQNNDNTHSSTQIIEEYRMIQNINQINVNENQMVIQIEKENKNQNKIEIEIMDQQKIIIENQKKQQISWGQIENNIKAYDIKSIREKYIVCIDSYSYGPQESADMHGVSLNNICRWRCRIQRKQGAGRKVHDEQMERKLIEWIQTIPYPTRKIIRTKAKQFSNSADFKASKGWYERFYQRRREILQVLLKKKNKKQNETLNEKNKLLNDYNEYNDMVHQSEDQSEDEY